MNTTNLVKHFNVLLFEDNPRHRERFRGWLLGVPTKMTTRPEDLFRVFDPHTVTVCLSASLLGEDEVTIRRYILGRNQYCQLVLIVPEAASTPEYAKHYDVTLARPVSKSPLQTMVETRLKYGMYSALLKEFYVLNTKRIALQRSDGEEDTRKKERVEKQLTRVRVPLEQLRSTIDHDDMMELMISATQHHASQSEPQSTPKTAVSSKYRPDNCSYWGLLWGVDHGGILKSGFTKIGADVWKCARCHKVTRKPKSSNRRVVR